MASHVNNRAKGHNYGSDQITFGSDVINWASDTIKVLALVGRYVPDPDDAYVSDVIAYEAPGANRPTLTNRYVEVVNGSDMLVHYASNPVITGVSGSEIAGIQVYKEVGGSDSRSVLICWNELQTSYDPGGGNFTVEYPGGRVYKGT